MLELDLYGYPAQLICCIFLSQGVDHVWKKENFLRF